METKKPNELQDRKDLLYADLSWHLSFFKPAFEAYQEDDEEKLKDVIKRYNEFNGIEE